MKLKYFNISTFIIFCKSIIAYFVIMYLVYGKKTEFYICSVTMAAIYLGIILISIKIGPEDLWSDSLESDLWQDAITFSIPIIIFLLIFWKTLILSQILTVIIGSAVIIFLPIIIIGVSA